MSIKKSSLQQALIEAKEIERAAYESAKKAMETSLAPKIEEAVKEGLKTLSMQNIEEEIKISVAPGADLSVNMEADGTATISVEKEGEESLENSDNENSNNNIESMEIDNVNEEIFEVEGLEEVEAAAPTEVPAMPEAPAEEVPTEEVAVAEEIPTEAVDIESELASINKKLDALIADETSEETAETGEGSEGEIEIVDDETENLEAPIETAVAPAMDEMEEIDEMEEMEGMFDSIPEEETEEIVYEIEEDVNDTFDSMDELEEIEITDDSDFSDDLDEIEIIDDEEEIMDEAGMGLGNTILRQANQRQRMIKGDRNHAPVAIKENKKVQNESFNDELKKENQGLKETIKEYKESFIVLRKQINEIQTFNAKLAYANKLFTNGGLTNNEKIKIAEEFDKVETIEESKKLYNKLLSEFNSSKVSKNPTEKLKSVKAPTVMKNSENTTQPLYESVEMKRMKKLAGIID